MSDRKAAGLFSEVFRAIDDEVRSKDARARLVQRFWDLSQEFDFTPEQMGIERVLTRLGLARKIPARDGNSTVWEYGPKPEGAPMRVAETDNGRG